MSARLARERYRFAFKAITRSLGWVCPKCQQREIAEIETQRAGVLLCFAVGKKISGEGKSRAYQ
ncbi:MAG: hypothetical protein HGB26_08755 [Desulfobulbaceae bacterium]|nr:hypothetical protein [Desulfobulbaceae bacterium]